MADTAEIRANSRVIHRLYGRGAVRFVDRVFGHAFVRFDGEPAERRVRCRDLENEPTAMPANRPELRVVG